MSDDVRDEWHTAAAKELEPRVRSRMFHVRLSVTGEPGDGSAGPAELGEDAWDGMAAEVEEWLGGLDPDTVDADAPPEHELRAGAVAIRLAAMPRKPARRGKGDLIINPFPGIAFFSGSYSTGPPPVFDDGT